jgi:hypothetical protein
MENTYQLPDFKVPSTVTVRPGQYVRFNVFGRFMEVVDFLTNGLGYIMQVQQDGTLRRVYF